MASPARTLQELRTSLAANEVLAEAKRFFPSRVPLYASFIDKEGPGFCTFRGQGGEEIALAVSPIDGGTLVTGSTYLFDMQLARFLSTLPELPAAR
jgi:hypothetical protein